MKTVLRAEPNRKNRGEYVAEFATEGGNRDGEEMLKCLSRVRIEFNPRDPRTSSCVEFLAQCNAAARQNLNKLSGNSNGCQVLVKRRTDVCPPQVALTYVDGTEEVVDAASTSAQALRVRILEKGQLLDTAQMFRDAGEKWPVHIPEDELHRVSSSSTKAFDRAADVQERQGKQKKGAGECEIKIKMKYFG